MVEDGNQVLPEADTVPDDRILDIVQNHKHLLVLQELSHAVRRAARVVDVRVLELRYLKRQLRSYLRLVLVASTHPHYSILEEAPLLQEHRNAFRQ